MRAALQKTDPQLYKLLEVSWEAWVDSGIDVRELRDSNRVGVYTGICGSEVCTYSDDSPHRPGGFITPRIKLAKMGCYLRYLSTVQADARPGMPWLD